MFKKVIDFIKENKGIVTTIGAALAGSGYIAVEHWAIAQAAIQAIFGQ